MITPVPGGGLPPPVLRELRMRVSGGSAPAAGTARETLTGLGWRLREQGEGIVLIERGDRRRTTFLGALAGKHFYVHAALEIAPAPGAAAEAPPAAETVVRLRWTERTGAVLGGAVGDRRARRLLDDAATALEGAFESAGRLVSAERLRR